MVRFRPGITRCHRLPGRVSGLAMAIGLLVAACSPAHTAATGGATGAPTARGTAEPLLSASPPPSSTGDQGCESVTTCYTPQQLQAAYGIMVLTVHGETITEVTGFADPSLFPLFGLPEQTTWPPAMP